MAEPAQVRRAGLGRDGDVQRVGPRRGAARLDPRPARAPATRSSSSTTRPPTTPARCSPPGRTRGSAWWRARSTAATCARSRRPWPRREVTSCCCPTRTTCGCRGGATPWPRRCGTPGRGHQPHHARRAGRARGPVRTGRLEAGPRDDRRTANLLGIVAGLKPYYGCAMGVRRDALTRCSRSPSTWWSRTICGWRCTATSPAPSPTSTAVRSPDGCTTTTPPPQGRAGRVRCWSRAPGSCGLS